MPVESLDCENQQNCAIGGPRRSGDRKVAREGQAVSLGVTAPASATTAGPIETDGWMPVPACIHRQTAHLGLVGVWCVPGAVAGSEADTRTADPASSG